MGLKYTVFEVANRKVPRPRDEESPILPFAQRPSSPIPLADTVCAVRMFTQQSWPSEPRAFVSHVEPVKCAMQRA